MDYNVLLRFYVALKWLKLDLATANSNTFEICLKRINKPPVTNILSLC
jgi:hypothetical protein